MKYSILLFLSILTISCENFLNEEPQNEFKENIFYNNDEELELAMIACYNGLQPTMQYEWLLTEVRSDNARIYSRNTTSTSSKTVINADHLTVPTTHVYNQQYWDAVYHNIANCNTVLDSIEVVGDSLFRAQLTGEALFLRSYHYFNLVRLYGPVFKVTSRISIEEANVMEKSTVDEIYDMIVSNLDSATTLLPESYDSEFKGRATSWAAKTLLAKVYLTLEDYEKAETLLLDVEQHSGHSLVQSAYSDIFSTSNEMNDEIIFAVQYLSGGYGLGSPFANFFAPNSSSSYVISYSGNGSNCPTYSLISAYTDADERKDATVAEGYIGKSDAFISQYWTTKYFSPVSVQYDAENDWPIIRFADVYLMLAEVKYQLEGVDAARPYINFTRTRAGLLPLEIDDLPDRLSCQLAIENERRLEFAMENHRFFDLVRTNRFITVMNEHFEEELIQATNGSLVAAYNDPSTIIYLGDREVDQWQLLLPIPYSVMTVASNASQNPGY